MNVTSARVAALCEQVRHFIETEAIPRENPAHIHDPAALDRTLTELRAIAKAAGQYLPQMPVQHAASACPGPSEPPFWKKQVAAIWGQAQ